MALFRRSSSCALYAHHLKFLFNYLEIMIQPASLIPLLFSIFSVFLSAEQIKIDIGAESAILMNADTGVILYSKDPHALYFPASTTKIATALYALHLKGGDLDQMVTVGQEALVTLNEEGKRQAGYSKPAYWLEPDGTHISLKKDEQISLKDLLRGTLIASGNDAANVVAQSVGEGSIPTFIQGMNIYLKEIGCAETSFLNPHGLHHPEHRTTAYDLALMTKKALENPIFCEIVSSVRFARPKTNLQKASTLLQGNKLLRPGKLYYSKAIGVKTGYHSRARHALVAAARSEDRKLIAVLLKNQDRTKMFEDATKLFETAFNQPKVRRVLLKEGVQKWSKKFSLASTPLKTYIKSSVTVSYYPAEDPEPKCLLYWKDVTLPIQKNTQVGELKVIANNGSELQTVPLFAYDTVQLKWPLNILAKIKSFAYDHYFLSAFIFVICLVVLAMGSGKLFGRR